MVQNCSGRVPQTSTDCRFQVLEISFDEIHRLGVSGFCLKVTISTSKTDPKTVFYIKSLERPNRHLRPHPQNETKKNKGECFAPLETVLNMWIIYPQLLLLLYISS